LVLVFVLQVIRDKALASLRLPVLVLIGAVIVQVALGISTLLWHVPLVLAAIHQAVALLLLSVMLYVVFRFRRA
jgi:cytochrome c oxidase assembly protein subunit 15